MGCKISYLQTACIIGYSSLPIVVAAFLSLITDFISYIVTFSVCLVAFVLAIKGSIGLYVAAYTFFVVVVTEDNKLLVLFPVVLFMFLFMWEILMVL